VKSVGSLWRSLVAYVSWKSFGSLMSQLFQIFILQINIETPELFENLPFIFYIFLIQGCAKGLFHFAQCKSQTYCLAIQSMSKVWCTTWVCNSTKNGTLAHIYKGKNKAPSFGPTWKFKDQYHFCFCVDDKFKASWATSDHMIWTLFIPLVWHVFKETNLTLEEVHHLEDVRFSLVVQRTTLCHVGFLEDLK
jgi:hypothetical protein